MESEDVSYKSRDDIMMDALQEVDTFVCDGEKVIKGISVEGEFAHVLVNSETNELFAFISPDDDGKGFYFATYYKDHEFSGQVDKSVDTSLDLDTLVNSISDLTVNNITLDMQKIQHLMELDFSAPAKDFSKYQYMMQYAMINNLTLLLSLHMNIQSYL